MIRSFRLVARSFVWMVLGSGCGILPDGKDPEGTWVGSCEITYSTSDRAIATITYDFQLDVTLDDTLAGALETAIPADDADEDTPYTALYDGVWTDPELSLRDDDGQEYVFVLSSEGDVLGGEYSYSEAVGDETVVASGPCELDRLEP